MDCSERARADAPSPAPAGPGSPGRVRLAFGAAVGQDSDDEVVYDWGRRGWGGGGHCLGNSLGDEKPRFYLSARQAAAILAAPNREHKFGGRPGCVLARACSCSRFAAGESGTGGVKDAPAVGTFDTIAAAAWELKPPAPRRAAAQTSTLWGGGATRTAAPCR